MEYKDYLDESKLKIESKKGLDNIPIIRFNFDNLAIVDLNHETVFKVINELNEIIEGDGN